MKVFFRCTLILLFVVPGRVFAGTPLQQIKLVSIVPDEKNNEAFFLVNPLCLAKANGSILISDQAQSQIYQLNLDGRLIRTIGKRGQGPGEFGNQSTIASNGKQIFVEDQGNRKVQILSMEGKFQSQFRQALLWRYFLPIGDDLLANPALPPSIATSPIKHNLLLFDVHGNRLKNIGSPFQSCLRGNRFDMANRLTLKSNGFSIFSIQYFGNIVRVYNPRLEMEDEFVLKHPAGNRIMGYVFDVVENQLFVAALSSYNSKSQSIYFYGYDTTGDFLGELELKYEGEEIVLKDLLVIRRDDYLWFYILLVEPECELVIGKCPVAWKGAGNKK